MRLRDLFLEAGTTYTLSLPGTFVSRLSFYLTEKAELAVEGYGSFSLVPGWNDIPINSNPSQLRLTPSSDCALSRFSVQGMTTSPSSPFAPNALYSAVYPASSALFTAYLIPSPYSATDAISLEGMGRCRVKASWCADGDVKKISQPTAQYPALTDFPLPKMISSCALSYSGQCSLNGVQLPSASFATYSFPENKVQAGSQSAEALIPWGGGVSIELGNSASAISSFTLTLDGDDQPYILYSSEKAMYLAGYTPSDFAPLTFLPVTGWQDCLDEIRLPSSFFGGVFRLDFTDLPSGITAVQEELAFEMFDRESSSINPAPSPYAAQPKPQPTSTPSPMILSAPPTVKTEERRQAQKLSTPFFSTNGAGAVFSNGNAFTGPSISSLSMDLPSLPADTSSPLSPSYQGFTGKVGLSKMGYSVAAADVECERDSFPVQGNTVYIDPWLLNGKTVTFAYPFQCVSLAPSASLPSGYLSSFPIPLDRTAQPENVYAITPSLDAFWSDPAVEWSSAEAAWGMDNPNLAFSYQPDLQSPYAIYKATKQTTLPLGARGAGKRPCGFSLSYLLSTGSSAQLVFNGSPHPLLADGSMHTLSIPPAILKGDDLTATASLLLAGEIRLYAAAFQEGCWSIGVTLDNGYRAVLDPIFMGRTVNLGYWTTSLTFDVTGYGPQLPSGFDLNASLRPDIDPAEENQFEPYQYLFFAGSNAHGTGFWQVEASGIDMNTGAIVSLPPQLFRYAITSDPQNAFSYFGDGWFYCSKEGATGEAEAYYGGSSYPVSI